MRSWTGWGSFGLPSNRRCAAGDSQATGANVARDLRGAIDIH